MTLKNTVGTLAHGAASTAVSAVRLPITTASMAAGLVKGTAEASFDLVRVVVRGSAPETDSEKDQMADRVASRIEDHVQGRVETPTQREETAAEPEVARPPATADVPRKPEVVLKPVPEIHELPEPIVIEADDASGESFHTEPKAATRDSEHGGLPGDREEVEGYVEEIPSAIIDNPVVWTSESSTAPEAPDLSRSI